VYDNLGISRGMKYGIARATEVGRFIVYRSLRDNWEEEQEDILKEHTHKTVWTGLDNITHFD